MKKSVASSRTDTPAAPVELEGVLDPAAYLVPTVIEKTGRGERAYDIYSRLLKDRIVFIGPEINDYTANLVVAQILFLMSENKNQDINMYINSPGGYLTAGLAIYDTMQFVPCDIDTYCIGQASSMGAVLLAAGTKGKRHALPHSRIMLHQPWGGTQGTAADIQIQAKELRRNKQILLDILAKHTGQPTERIEPMKTTTEPKGKKKPTITDGEGGNGIDKLKGKRYSQKDFKELSLLCSYIVQRRGGASHADVHDVFTLDMRSKVHPSTLSKVLEALRYKDIFAVIHNDGERIYKMKRLQFNCNIELAHLTQMIPALEDDPAGLAIMAIIEGAEQDTKEKDRYPQLWADYTARVKVITPLYGGTPMAGNPYLSMCYEKSPFKVPKLNLDKLDPPCQSSVIPPVRIQSRYSVTPPLVIDLDNKKIVLLTNSLGNLKIKRSITSLMLTQFLPV